MCESNLPRDSSIVIKMWQTNHWLKFRDCLCFVCAETSSQSRILSGLRSVVSFHAFFLPCQIFPAHSYCRMSEIIYTILEWDCNMHGNFFFTQLSQEFQGHCSAFHSVWELSVFPPAPASVNQKDVFHFGCSGFWPWLWRGSWTFQGLY